MTSETARLVSLRVGGEPELWRSLGFRVDGCTVRIGTTEIELVPGQSGHILDWTLAGIPPDVSAIDGLATTVAPAFEPGEFVSHPNGALQLDHVVVFTGSLDAFTAALEPLGVRCRRVREAGGNVRQGFYRLGEVILEAVEGATDAFEPTRFWGLVVIVDDIDRVAVQAGERLGRVKAAVQPGRMIATVRPQVLDGLPMAFLTPEPART